AVEAMVGRPSFFADPDQDDGGLNSPFSLEDLHRALNRMRNSAPGADGVVKRFVVWGGDVLLVSVLRLINLSWALGELPKSWKEAVMVPLPKRPSPSTPSHYRPVSLLAFLGKLMEQMVHERLEHVAWLVGAISP